MSHLLRSLALSSGLALVPMVAHAVDCDAIMNMASVNVPSPTIIQTMKGSGHSYTAEDIACLQQRGAPADVLAAARALSAPTAPTAPPVPAGTPAAAPSSFDSAPTLGADLGDPDTLEMDVANGPAAVERLVEAYRAQNYQTASKGLYELHRDNTYPEFQTKIAYYLAKSLEDDRLYHSAQHYYTEVVKKGPTNPYFKYALPAFVRIAEHTGNDYMLLKIVDKIPPESFPRAARNHLLYLMGRKLFEDKELADASSNFQQVSANSYLFMRAQYYEGIINNERGKLKSAVLAFGEVNKAQPVVRDDQHENELMDMRDLATMNIARIYYGLERYPNAEEWYLRVRRDSTYWPESLFERAWSSFMVQDLNQSLGLLLTVKSPYFAQQEFIPEIEILRALTFFNLCEYDQVENILTAFSERHTPMVMELENLINHYKNKENRVLADQVFDTYFVKGKADSRLEPAFFARLLRNRDLAAYVNHLDMMDDEVARIDTRKADWRDSVGDTLKKVIAQDRQKFKQRAGLVMLREMLHEYNNLQDLLLQAETISFEVVDAQRLDYEFKMGNPDVDAAQEKPIDYATDPYTIYWPFNGEFWRDELGYYEFTEHGNCQ